CSASVLRRTAKPKSEQHTEPQKHLERVNRDEGEGIPDEAGFATRCCLRGRRRFFPARGGSLWLGRCGCRQAPRLRPTDGHGMAVAARSCTACPARTDIQWCLRSRTYPRDYRRSRKVAAFLRQSPWL